MTTRFTLISCFLLAGATSGFSTKQNRGRESCVSPLFAVDPVVYDIDDAEDTKRRAAIASIFAVSSVATFSLLGLDKPGSPASSIVDSSSSFITKVASVDDAVLLIESSCDRRFLHAVVASDYQLMYRGLPSSTKKQGITTRNEPETALESSSSSSETADASAVLASIETILQDRPLQPSNSKLAVSNPETAKQWGSQVVSVWPLGENVHFAWPEEGTAFSQVQVLDDKDDTTTTRKIIVDGVDCGRMSLEDALESNKEILFRAESGYLAVPLSMEKELVSKLKGAFII
jgi:hypothetical protein